MDVGQRIRLVRELRRNEKRIEECLSEASILDNRNIEIKKELEE